MENLISLLPVISVFLDLLIPTLTWMVEHWYISLPVLFIQFAALMKLDSKFREAAWWNPFRLFLFLYFQPQNISVNWIFCSVIFLDLPVNPIDGVTGRMKRYKRFGGVSDSYAHLNWDWIEQWRFSFAHWLCRQLSKHDPDHC